MQYWWRIIDIIVIKIMNILYIHNFEVKKKVTKKFKKWDTRKNVLPGETDEDNELKQFSELISIFFKNKQNANKTKS